MIFYPQQDRKWEFMHILLADDHVLFRDALNQFMRILKPDWIMTQCSDFDEAFDLLQRKKSPFDLVLLDFRMPGMHGLDGLNKIVENFPEQKTAIISGVIEEDMVHQALSMGAAAYFPKTLTGKTLIKAIELVLDGERFVPLKDYGASVMPSYYDDKKPEASVAKKNIQKRREEIMHSLTRREHDVIQYLALGLSNKEIANKLDLQIATVKLHVSGICKKMDADNRTKAAIMAHQMGIVSSQQAFDA